MGKLIRIRKRGQKPMEFKAGQLHRDLNVPEGQPIPPAKKAAALAGKHGKKVQARARFAFRGALAKGRKTAAAHRGSSQAPASKPAAHKAPASKPQSTAKMWSNAYKKK